MLVVKMEYSLLSEEDIEVRPTKAAMNYQTYAFSVRNKVARFSSIVSKEIVCLCYVIVLSNELFRIEFDVTGKCA